MNHYPLVSIYTPCYNYGKYLDEAIQSVIHQSYKNYNYFIINDASDDPFTIDFFETLAKENTRENFHIISHAKRHGLAACANHVLSICSSEFILRLDADDWLAENALSSLVSKALTYNHTSMVYSGYYYTNEKGDCIGIEKTRHINNNSNVITPAHGACSLISVRALKSIGGYETSVKAQDGWDLWLRIKTTGQILTIKEPLFYYRQYASSLSKSSERILRARSEIYRKRQVANTGSYKPSVLLVLPIKPSYFANDLNSFNAFESKLKVLLNEINSSDQNLQIIASLTENTNSINLLADKYSRFEVYIRPSCSTHNKNIPMQSILQSSLDHLDHTKPSLSQPDIISYLNFHNLPDSLSDIYNCLNILLVHNATAVVSVNDERSLLFKDNTDSLQLLNKGRFFDLRYEDELYYRFDGMLILSWTSMFLSDNFLLDGRIFPYFRGSYSSLPIL